MTPYATSPPAPASAGANCGMTLVNTISVFGLLRSHRTPSPNALRVGAGRRATARAGSPNTSPRPSSSRRPSQVR